jgi:hypothetical protein
MLRMASSRNGAVEGSGLHGDTGASAFTYGAGDEFVLRYWLEASI